MMLKELDYVTDPNILTPVIKLGNNWVKRDDLFQFAGVNGGKVRTCLYLAKQSDKEGLITAGSSASPQVNIVAHIAKALGKKCRVHIPSGKLSPESISAQETGAEIIQHKPGYNSVIIKRANDDAKALGWTNIPFGMECREAVDTTRRHVFNLPFGEFKSIILSVGSGMSLAGILWGLYNINQLSHIKIKGIVVGADPVKRLDKFAPNIWRDIVELITPKLSYHKSAPNNFNGLLVDPHYEAKCLPYIEEGDLFWIIGRREKI